jgi:AcrR family transcriptional regulator
MTAPTVHRPYRGVTADERRSQRRTAMVEAGLEVFGTIGYAAASVDAVCAQAGLTKRYFYESFDSLETLLVAVYDEATSRVRTQVQAVLETEAGQGAVPAALAGVGAFLQALDEDRRLARAMFREVLGVSERVDRAYLSGSSDWEVLIALVTSDISITGVEPDALVAAGWGLVAGLTLRWVMADFREPVDQLITTVQIILSRVLLGVPEGSP